VVTHLNPERGPPVTIPLENVRKGGAKSIGVFRSVAAAHAWNTVNSAPQLRWSRQLAVDKIASGIASRAAARAAGRAPGLTRALLGGGCRLGRGWGLAKWLLVVTAWFGGGVCYSLKLGLVGPCILHPPPRFVARGDPTTQLIGPKSGGFLA
jgi:hypothetical protein